MTLYGLRISDWSSDVCSSDLSTPLLQARGLARKDRWRPRHVESASIRQKLFPYVPIARHFPRLAQHHRGVLRMQAERVDPSADIPAAKTRRRASERLQIGRAHV